MCTVKIYQYRFFFQRKVLFLYVPLLILLLFLLDNDLIGSGEGGELGSRRK